MAKAIAGLTLLLAAGWAHAQEIDFQVELLNRIGTDSCRKGDLVTAKVLAPAGLAASTVEGKVTECASGTKNRGQSALDISFDVLRHAGGATPISSRINTIYNSKGQVNVDEDGRPIRQSAPKPSSGTGGLGRTLGGLAGGRGGQIGNAVDHTATVMARMSTDAPNLRFDPGARFLLRASARSGPSLASLGAAKPAPAPVTTSTSVQTQVAPHTNLVAIVDSGAQPDLKAVKAEFVPGDKTLFFDDFSDMSAGDAPAHWKVRGGTAELRQGGEVRQLTVNSRRVVLTPNLTGLPKNFTMETVMKYNGHASGLYWTFRKKAPQEAMMLRLEAVYTKLSIVCRVGTETITSQQIPIDWTKPFRQELWLQKGRMRLYINGERIFDVNQIDLGQIESLDANVFTEQTPNQPERYVGFQSVRFAESVPDFSDVITSTGRYAVRGILFDTDSDRIKPESAPAIRQIARVLEANTALKLLIEGHTDSVGDAAHNLDLSKRRAEAVRAALVAQFNIDAARLSAAGLGATKPVEPNDTPQGRAQNRRVELVRM